MPSFTIAGKSKEDLVVIAQLSGLLSAEEAARLTRTELAKLLEKENRKAEASALTTAIPPAAADETAGATVRGKRPTRPRKEPAAPAPAAVAPEPAALSAVEPETVRPVRIRAVKGKKPAAVPADATAPVQMTMQEAEPDQPAVVPVSEPTPVDRPVARARARKTVPAVKSLPVTVEPAAAEPAQPEIAAEPAPSAPAAAVPAAEIDLPVQPTDAAAAVLNENIPTPAVKRTRTRGRKQPVAADESAVAEPAVAEALAVAEPAVAEALAVAEPAAVPAAAIAEPTAAIAVAATESASAPQEGKMASRTRSRRRTIQAEPASTPGEQPETPIAPPAIETAMPAAIETSQPIGQLPAAEAAPAVQPRETPATGRSGRTPGRKPRQTASTGTEQPSIQEVAPTQLSQPAPAVEPAAIPAGNLTAVPDVKPELSPEAAEAASDLELAQTDAEIHRVPPHHTLAPSHPGQRRTRVIGNPPETPPQSPVEQPSVSRSGPTRSPQGSVRPAGRPFRPGMPGSRPTGELNRPSAHPYPSGASQEPAVLSDVRLGGAEPLADESEAEATAAIIPILPALEGEAAKAAHPAVETGDVQAGVLEIMPDGYGFLRKENYLQGNKDIYVPPQYIRRFGLRPGDFITGPVKLQRESDRYQALLYIKDVNGLPPEKMLRRPHFDRLTPIYPDERFVLETVRTELSTRIIDLVAPIGKGQRGMIVSPPKAGKTILLQKIANAISTNNPDVKLIVLLIDERPEEVTDMQRSIKGEVVYSTFDKTPENHTKVTELVLERAMRLVELKQDVVILLDSMTRLARAYNLTINPTGRTLSGGLDPGALYGPKRFFGAARNIENGGSLTIIATSLIETGSRMDEVIFEEFKGTGNMEVYLDRKMSEKRIFPAIDINKSGTRREELLMSSKELDAVWTIRKAFSQLENTAVTEAIINLLLKTKNNEHFIASVNVSFNDKNVFEAMRGVRPQDAAQNQNQGQNQGPGGRGGSSYGGGYNTTGYSSNYRRQQSNDDD